MENQLLSRFNADAHTKEVLKDFLRTFFEQKIVEKAYNNEDVRPAAEAIKLLELAFDEIEYEYGIKDAKTVETPSSK